MPSPEGPSLSACLPATMLLRPLGIPPLRLLCSTIVPGVTHFFLPTSASPHDSASYLLLSLCKHAVCLSLPMPHMLHWMLMRHPCPHLTPYTIPTPVCVPSSICFFFLCCFCFCCSPPLMCVEGRGCCGSTYLMLPPLP